VFTLRLAPEELQMLYRAASRLDETLSDFILKGALERAKALEQGTKRPRLG
jgi:uncharacterized protein (DUF1778 family)